MKKMLTIAATLWLLGGCGQLEPRPLEIAKIHPPEIVSPVLSAGQQWTYRRVDLWRKREIERFRQEFLMPDEALWIVRWNILNSDNQARMGSITGEIFDPRYHSFADARLNGHYEPLRFPLKEGKTWTFTYSMPGSNQLKVTQTATVRGWEEVNVPAGRFSALRISHEGNYSATDGLFSWSGRISETYWYSPDARRVVKREYRDTSGEGLLWDQWRDELVEMKL